MNTFLVGAWKGPWHVADVTCTYGPFGTKYISSVEKILKILYATEGFRSFGPTTLNIFCIQMCHELICADLLLDLLQARPKTWA